MISTRLQNGVHLHQADSPDSHVTKTINSLEIGSKSKFLPWVQTIKCVLPPFTSSSSCISLPIPHNLPIRKHDTNNHNPVGQCNGHTIRINPRKRQLNPTHSNGFAPGQRSDRREIRRSTRRNRRSGSDALALGSGPKDQRAHRSHKLDERRRRTFRTTVGFILRIRRSTDDRSSAGVALYG